MISDDDLLYELQKYGEKITRISDANRDICIKKLNHHKARQKLQENPSKQAKAINMNKKYKPLDETKVTSTEDSLNYTRQNPYKSYLYAANDSINQTSEYVQVANAGTSPMSNSMGIRYYDRDNDSDSDIIVIEPAEDPSVQLLEQDSIKKRVLKEKYDVEQKLQKHREEINSILNKSKQIAQSGEDYETDSLRKRLNRLKENSIDNKVVPKENKFKIWLTAFKRNSINWSLKISKLLPYLLVLFFFLIIALYTRMKMTANNITIQSLVTNMFTSQPKELMYCSNLDDKKCQQTRQMARDLIDYLRIHAGEVTCGYRADSEKLVSYQDVKNFFKKKGYLVEDDVTMQQRGINSVISAILANQDWEIKLLGSDFSETRIPNEVKYFESLKISKNFSCKLNESIIYWTKKLFVYGLALASLIITALIIVSVYNNRQHKKKSFYETIKQVVSAVERQYEENRIDPSIDSYVVISHMFDTLYEPSQRQSERANWARIVKFINENESRIREETKIINGEETQVWQWQVPKKLIPDNSPLHSLSTSALPIKPSLVPQPIIDDDDLILTQDKVPDLSRWQGDAIQKQSNSSLKCPTSCLKIRNMFDDKIVTTNPLFFQKIRYDILNKCRFVDSILHICCDEKSKEGCVYVKCDTNEAAGKVYQLLNGTWYDGKLLSVKFLRNDRYLERFPDSINYTRPLHI